MPRRKKDNRHWFHKARRPKVVKQLRFTKAQWKYLDFNRNVEASLDRMFEKGV